MQLQHPFRTITPTIDGDVLRVLAGSDSWFTVARIRSLAGSGSPEGIRRVLRRLAEQGVVDTQPAGKAVLHKLNRDHLAAPAILDLSRLDRELHDRIRAALAAFRVAPRFAVLFGSGARLSMRLDSDLDLLLVRDRPASDEWSDDVSELTRRIHRWTGNDPRIIEYGRDDIRGAAAEEPLLESIADEGIVLTGSAARFRKEVAGT
ncbi:MULTISPECIES: hypothetical protein [Clavibacter]|uniref:Nucleotidyltransferase domain-containing protein n=1 Tax=Clavibacter tessellarius TaxID=31965 RepID=A0A225C5Q6_9MICO|nr:hypothetical protein [Clavibacter michiganensis]OQJ61929.1 hypothetical protein B5P24_02240 [Clavibacter michiganensis subsp. tessellarius]